MWLTRRCRLAAEMARTRQSVLLPKAAWRQVKTERAVLLSRAKGTSSQASPCQSRLGGLHSTSQARKVLPSSARLACS